ncbi:hypothetical protein T484DRAFT_1756925 [Baffinella frigidus]|nr:hypothetical protein T484DRAFT_1756925 [Cryptophyta sp. CCMP2293]
MSSGSSMSNMLSMPPVASTTNTNPTTTNRRKPQPHDELYALFTEEVKKCDGVALLLLHEFLTANTDEYFYEAQNNVIIATSFPDTLHEFIVNYIPALDEGWLSKRDIAKMDRYVKSLMYVEPVGVHSINGRLYGSYHTPPPSIEQTRAYDLYTNLQKTLTDPDTIEDIEDIMDLFRKSARVQWFVNGYDSRVLKSSRHAPVVLSATQGMHNTCKCDKLGKGIVRVSGCSKCCTNMPIDVSFCKCQPHFKLWQGLENAKVMCNHAGTFDPTKFAMTYFETGVCTICSELTNGHCEHRVLAEDARELHNYGVVNHWDIEYVNKRIAELQEYEHTYLQRKRVTFADVGDDDSQEKSRDSQEEDSDTDREFDDAREEREEREEREAALQADDASQEEDAWEQQPDPKRPRMESSMC